MKIYNLQVVGKVQLPTCTKENETQERHVPAVGAGVKNTFELEVEGENAVCDRNTQSRPDVLWPHNQKRVEIQIRILFNDRLLYDSVM